MAAKNASHGLDADPSKAQRSDRGRDGRKATQNDSTDESTNNHSKDNPPHGHISHGSARFLLWVGKRRDRIDGFDPAVTELEELHEDWKQRQNAEQTSLEGWSG